MSDENSGVVLRRDGHVFVDAGAGLKRCQCGALVSDGRRCRLAGDTELDGVTFVGGAIVYGGRAYPKRRFTAADRARAIID